jgi:uncharacterized delta-60 repeat protein
MVLAAMALLAMFPTVPAGADPGDLDPSFGVGGKVISDFGGNNVAAFGVHLRPDGKLVVSGCFRCFPSDPLDTDFAVAQYNSDGTLDTAFGTGGITIVDFGREDPLAASVLQPDGRVVLAGSSTLPYDPDTRDFALTRVNADGTVDSAFGAGGKVLTHIGFDDQLNDVVLQPDGKIVVGGFSVVNGRNFALARYNADGSLDTSFGAGGTVVTNIGGEDQVIRRVALQADDRIVVGGHDGENVVVGRYSPDGSLDASFGSGGIVKTEIAGAGRDLGFAVNVLANGKVLVGGLANDEDFALLRYNPDGTLDPTFGGDGIVMTDFGLGQDIIYNLAELADGRYLAIGEASSPDRSFGLALYHPDGTLDTRFGTGGLVTTTFGQRMAVARGLAIQPDGKAVLAGITADVNPDFALARYVLGGPPRCTIDGTPGDDVLFGTNGSDVICGRGGNDVIFGRKGDDLLRGGPGDDRILGGSGSDLIWGEAGNDIAVGGPHGDTIIGGPGDDVLRGRAGDDRLEGTLGNDALYGGGGDDALFGGPGTDLCKGGGGSDAYATCE